MADQDKEQQQDYSVLGRASVTCRFDISVRGKREWQFAGRDLNSLMIVLNSFAPNYELSEPKIEGKTIDGNYVLYDGEIVDFKAVKKPDIWS